MLDNLRQIERINLSRYKYLLPYTFTLQGFKEAFYDRIVITVASSAHAGSDVALIYFMDKVL